MISIRQALQPIGSTLAYAGAGAAMGAVTCAVGGAIIGSAAPSVAAGAVTLGVAFGASRVIGFVITRCQKNNQEGSPLENFQSSYFYVRFIALPIGGLTATALGMPITFKATILLFFASFPTTLLVVSPPIALTYMYIRRNGIPQFVNNAFEERIQNTERGQNRDRLIRLQERVNSIGQNRHGIRV